MSLDYKQSTMNRDVLVLPLEKKDIPAYRMLIKHTLKSVQSEEYYQADLESTKFSRYFKLLKRDQLIGILSIWHTFDDIQIVTIAVDPSMQGNGFGDEIMCFLLNYAKNFSVKRISLEVRMSNHVAIQYYEKYGFKKEAIRKNYYKDGEDAHLMVRTV